MPGMPHRDADGQPAVAAVPLHRREDVVELARASVDAVYRTDARRMLATLICLLGDFRRRRGGAARGLRRGGRAMVTARCAGQPEGVAHLHRPLQSDRWHTAACAGRRVAADTHQVPGI